MLADEILWKVGQRPKARAIGLVQAIASMPLADVNHTDVLTRLLRLATGDGEDLDMLAMRRADRRLRSICARATALGSSGSAVRVVISR